MKERHVRLSTLVEELPEAYATSAIGFVVTRSIGGRELTCDEIDLLLPEYILGELTPDQTDEINQHLANGCEICQYNLRDLNAAAVAVFDDVRPIRPPDDVLTRVYERLKIAMDRGCRS